MKKVVIFGVGKLFQHYYSSIKTIVKIVAVTDNNPIEQKKCTEQYIKPDQITEINFDFVLVCSTAFEEICKQLILYGIEEIKIKPVRDFLYSMETIKYHLEPFMQERSTSVTDQREYPALCKMASIDTNVFNNFKKSAIYIDVLEHVSYEQGQKYLDAINNNTVIQLQKEDWLNFQQNDWYGSPQTYSYYIRDNWTLDISPTTIRYIKVLQEIRMLFDWSEFNTIAEIGVGYGGQARILMECLPIQQYCLVDLPEVLKLAETFLDKFNHKDKLIFCDGTKLIENRKYDFLISNYAFSEVTRENQEKYLNSIILQSKAGYMIWNNLSYVNYKGYSVEELLNIIPDSKVMKEEPLTSPENKLIVWGIKK